MNIRLLACLLSACSLPQSALDAQAANPWYSQVILETGTKLGGCAVGDVDPEHPGNEVLAVAENGKVYLARPYGRRWVGESIAKAPGELLQCAVGDYDASKPGQEIVVVGMKSGGEDSGGKGAAYALERKGKTWKLRLLMEDSALLHAACVAEVDPDLAGQEIIVGGYGKMLWVLGGPEQKPIGVMQLDGPAKSIQAHRGGVAVACSTGELLWIKKEGASWTKTVLEKGPVGQARLGGSGEQLAVARDDGQLMHYDAEGQATPIHREKLKLRGAVLAELDPDWKGLEAASVGYEMKMVVHYQEAGKWFSEVVHTDDNRFHHLAVGELDDSSPGLEIVGCGYSGRLIIAGLAGAKPGK